jgi:putative oxidoreductase
MDVGLLILRILLACVLYAHATQKVFGWFSGPGLDGAAAIFDKLGQRPGRTMAVVAALCESSAAFLLLLGAVTPLGAAIAAGTMFVAGMSMVSMAGTFWNAAGGGEYPFVLAAASVVLAFTGAGAYSLDAAFETPWHQAGDGPSVLIGIGAVALALIAATPPLVRVRLTSTAMPTPAGPPQIDG